MLGNVKQFILGTPVTWHALRRLGIAVLASLYVLGQILRWRAARDWVWAAVVRDGLAYRMNDGGRKFVPFDKIRAVYADSAGFRGDPVVLVVPHSGVLHTKIRGPFANQTDAFDFVNAVRQRLAQRADDRRVRQ